MNCFADDTERQTIAPVMSHKRRPGGWIAVQLFVGDKTVRVVRDEAAQLHHVDAGLHALEVEQIERKLTGGQDQAASTVRFANGAHKRRVVAELRANASVLLGLQEYLEVVEDE
jgi:hypothetical protein